MSERQPLLVELGTEELPPKALAGAVARVQRTVSLQGLRDAALAPGAVHGFATPRRLAVFVDDVLAHQPDRRIERRGPPVKVSFDAQGQPTRAALAFAESCGVRHRPGRT